MVATQEVHSGDLLLIAPPAAIIKGAVDNVLDVEQLVQQLTCPSLSPAVQSAMQHLFDGIGKLTPLKYLHNVW